MHLAGWLWPADGWNYCIIRKNGLKLLWMMWNLSLSLREQPLFMFHISGLAFTEHTNTILNGHRSWATPQLTWVRWSAFSAYTWR